MCVYDSCTPWDVLNKQRPCWHLHRSTFYPSVKLPFTKLQHTFNENTLPGDCSRMDGSARRFRKAIQPSPEGHIDSPSIAQLAWPASAIMRGVRRLRPDSCPQQCWTEIYTTLLSNSLTADNHADSRPYKNVSQIFDNIFFWQWVSQAWEIMWCFYMNKGWFCNP